MDISDDARRTDAILELFRSGKNCSFNQECANLIVARLDALQATVDKLPKYKDGPFYIPGKCDGWAWVRYVDEYESEDWKLSKVREPNHDELGDGYDLDWIVEIAKDDTEYEVDGPYSTKEAAEAAKPSAI